MRYARVLGTRPILLLAGALLAPLLPAQDAAPPAQAAPAPAPDGGAPAEAAPERGLRLHEAGAQPGYTLISPLLSRSTFLLDLDGKVVHRWETPYAPGNSELLLDNGHLLRLARIEDNPVFHGGGIGGRVQEFDWDGKLVWDFPFSDEQRIQHHDFERLPDGNLLLIAWERRSREQAIERGRDPQAVGDEGIWPDAVYEIQPVLPDGGRIVWEWHAWDHLIQDFDASKAGYGSIPDHPELLDINADHRDQPPLSEAERRAQAEEEARLAALGYVGGKEPEPKEPAADGAGAGGGRPENSPDWMHTNAVAYNAELDLILLSSPHLDEIWIIDHSTSSAQAATHGGGRYGHGGDLLWRYGNPRHYGAGGEAQQRLFGQHDARWIAPGRPGAGHVLVFNNGQDRPGGNASSVEELVLPFDKKTGFTRAAGSAFGPEAPVWSYSAPDFYSSFISGADRLTNGDTLICSGENGRIFEVTPDARIVWEYLNPFGGEVKPSFGRGGPQAGGGPPPGGPPPGGAPPPGGPQQGPGPGGAQQGPGPGGPGRSGIQPIALFRATRIPLDHPGLAGRTL